MNFESVEKVEEVIDTMLSADRQSRLNRARINRLFNGEAAWDDQEAEENHVQTNYNSLEGTNIAHNARSQLDNAFLKPGNYFNVTLDTGPIYYRSGWGRTITKHINRAMKKSLCYTENFRSMAAQLVLHGVGPSLWENDYCWYPCMLGLNEILIPAKTKVSLENLDHFAVRRQYTPGQLYRMTHGKYVDEGWKMPLVNELLKSVADTNLKANEVDSRDPEALSEAYKEHGGYFETDAVPTIDCWDMYYRGEDSDSGKWKRKIVADEQGKTKEKRTFLYAPKKDRFYADDLSHIIHFQFANGANVAPFRIHSVRSIGWLLFSVCQVQNRLRCRFADSVFESMMWYFRNVGAEDRERLMKIDLHHMGIFPEGVNIVPAQERFQVNENMILGALSQNRQLMSENSASFTQDITNGQKEGAMTATETMARVNSTTAMVSGMTNLAYVYEAHKYNEICRRFCLKDNKHKDVKKFREACLRDGVPESALDAESWNIEPERSMGDGNRTIQMAQSQALMEHYNLHDPDSQRKLLHMSVEAITNEASVAEDLVPAQQVKVTDARHDAQLAAGAMMMGLPVDMKQGINHIDYVEALLGAMGAVVGRIEQSGDMASEEEIIGLQNLAGETVDGQPIEGNGIANHIALIAQDKNEAQRVKQYGDALGKMMNLCKAYAQRLQEQQGHQGQQLPPEAQAKIISSTILAQSSAKIKEATAMQKLGHKDQAFAAEQQRKDAAHQLELSRTLQDQAVDNAAKDLETAAVIHREASKPVKPSSGA